MITRLTREQEARFPEFIEKWTAIGLSTLPADRERAERAITGLYGLAKLREPRIIWLPCPMSAGLSALCFAKIVNHPLLKDIFQPAVRSAVRSAVGSAVGSAVESAVESAVGSAVRSAVRSAVGSAVRSAVESAVGSAVRSAVGSAVRSAVRSAVGSAVYWAGYSYYAGSLWPGYAAWADYFNEVFGVAIDRHYLDLIESCGFYWLLDGVCFASERPSTINLDERGRLHCVNGQSIGYRSGWGLWHWHGTQVSADVILRPETLTPRGIFDERNTEVRRAMIEIYG